MGLGFNGSEPKYSPPRPAPGLVNKTVDKRGQFGGNDLFTCLGDLQVMFVYVSPECVS